ncbi:glycosyltransferase family 4 protein [Methanobacterium aggregans]|uniref:glycosyltransferase family 4 protein n=1 Tax=Methanobacterium aggregans TaxID=1615586 RepID=UPI001AE94B00|nr:glycosyltransferase family 4 protein [Methanobacterium aggregans]MBP2047056.1 glycosyltransferase involved in cell wall biosynthesis [Methanobacterium aggregans]
MYNPFKPKKKIKIAIITNIPTPYRKKQWEYYSNCEYLDITVFYCANIEKDRYWNVDSSEGIKEVFLRGISFRSFHFNPGVLKTVFQDFDAFFVGGYGYPSVLMSIFALKLLKKPWVMIIDGICPLNLKKGNFIIEKIKKTLINGADAYFANGTVSAKYLEKYEVPPKKIFNQYMTVDVDYFVKKGNDASKFRSEIRKKYDINENSVVIMYAGRLIEHKGVQDLIKSVKNLKNRNINVKTLIVGEGNFKKELIKQSEDIREEVIFAGHVDPAEIYKYYYASDIFVLPTYDDPWGLVVNEAMACGLPVIVTDATGCFLDLVKDNGYIVKSHDICELSLSIEKAMKNSVKLGNNSYKQILGWNYEHSLMNIINLICYITSL